jgi:hypothetical protein
VQSTIGAGSFRYNSIFRCISIRHLVVLARRLPVEPRYSIDKPFCSCKQSHPMPRAETIANQHQGFDSVSLLPITEIYA